MMAVGDRLSMLSSRLITSADFSIAMGWRLVKVCSGISVLCLMVWVLSTINCIINRLISPVCPSSVALLYVRVMSVAL